MLESSRNDPSPAGRKQQSESSVRRVWGRANNMHCNGRCSREQILELRLGGCQAKRREGLVSLMALGGEREKETNL